MRRFVVGLTASVLLGACQDSVVDPYVEGKHFTVYGYLSLFDNEHFVRVIPVRRYPEHIDSPGDPQAEIDAEVFSTNLSTEETIPWAHSLVKLSDGSYGHVFSARFVVTAGVTYRLTVHRSDGVETTATTTVPSNIDAEALPATVDADSVRQVIRLKNVPKVDKLEVVYCAAPVTGPICADGIDGKSGYVAKYRKSGRRIGSDWEVSVDLSRDFTALRQIAGVDPDTLLVLKSLEMRAIALDEHWIVYEDPYVFAQPSALTNVENGFGFWGAVGIGFYSWTPDAAALAVLRVTP